MTVRKKIFIGVGAFFIFCVIVVGLALFLLFDRSDGKYFESNGVSLFYTVEGEGCPVILIHGLAANADLNWRRPGIVRMLAQEFKVITFDLRGHGLSGKPDNPKEYGIQMVEDILRLMDHLGIPKAHVVGYSLGGFLAHKAVILHPDRFISASLCAAGWKDPVDPDPLPNPYRPPETPHVRKAAVYFGFTNTLFHRLRSYIGDLLIDSRSRKYLKSSFSELAISRDEVQGCPVPLLCIIGSNDGFLPLAYDLANIDNDVIFVEIPQATHFSTLFHPVFKRELVTFLRRHRP